MGKIQNTGRWVPHELNNKQMDHGKTQKHMRYFPRSVQNEVVFGLQFKVIDQCVLPVTIFGTHNWSLKRSTRRDKKSTGYGKMNTRNLIDRKEMLGLGWVGLGER